VVGGKGGGLERALPAEDKLGLRSMSGSENDVIVRFGRCTCILQLDLNMT
jgi:hypothetical protein